MVSGSEPGVRLAWSEASERYEFDTGQIAGHIEPYTWYHGISRLSHKDARGNIVLAKQRKAFLNAEYFLSPGSGRHMRPRRLSAGKQTTHELLGDMVVIHFPPEPEYRFKMDLTYRPHGDTVDMEMKIMPFKDVPGFEIFFASYVSETLRETWVPLKRQNGSRQWTKLDNRQVLNKCFGIVRDESEHARLKDGRFDTLMTDPTKCKLEALSFHEPILVARNPDAGFALVFLCDPDRTTLLAGQYHGADTAHDWCFGTNLVAGKPMTARVRMIYRRFDDAESMFRQVEHEVKNATGFFSQP
jgi:hypothetical protein